jgi:hypothetical protein
VTATKAILYIIGALAELGGILLIAWPDFIPGAVRFAAWLRHNSGRVENRLRSLLGLKPRIIVHEGAGTITGKGRLSGSGIVSHGPNTLEGNVDFLPRREQANQEAINKLVARVSASEEEAPERLAELRRELREHVTGELAEMQADYRAARVGGACALAIGLTLTTIASFMA